MILWDLTTIGTRKNRNSNKAVSNVIQTNGKALLLKMRLVQLIQHREVKLIPIHSIHLCKIVFLVLELVVSHLTWVLGTKLRSSGRKIHTLLTR